MMVKDSSRKKKEISSHLPRNSIMGKIPYKVNVEMNDKNSTFVGRDFHFTRLDYFVVITKERRKIRQLIFVL